MAPRPLPSAASHCCSSCSPAVSCLHVRSGILPTCMGSEWFRTCRCSGCDASSLSDAGSAQLGSRCLAPPRLASPCLRPLPSHSIAAALVPWPHPRGQRRRPHHAQRHSSAHTRTPTRVRLCFRPLCGRALSPLRTAAHGALTRRWCRVPPPLPRPPAHCAAARTHTPSAAGSAVRCRQPLCLARSLARSLDGVAAAPHMVTVLPVTEPPRTRAPLSHHPRRPLAGRHTRVCTCIHTTQHHSLLPVACRAVAACAPLGSEWPGVVSRRVAWPSAGAPTRTVW